MANKLYKVDESTIVFGSDGTDDVAWTTESVADGTGWESAQHDQGVGSTARPYRWTYRIVTEAQATPTLGQALRCFLKTSDGTHVDNDTGTTDAVVTVEDKLRNLTPLRSPIVDEAAAATKFVSHGIINIPERYFQIVFFNDMGATTSATASATKAFFTPIPPELQ